MVAGLELTPIDVRGPLNAAIAEITGKGFDVVTAPPMRLALLRVGPAEHVMVFVIHHIGGDGSSLGPLARDFMAAYSARARGPCAVMAAAAGPVRRLRAVAGRASGHARRRRGTGTRPADGLLEAPSGGAPERLDLPSDRPCPAVPTFGGARVGFEIPARLVNAFSKASLARATRPCSWSPMRHWRSC